MNAVPLEVVHPVILQVIGPHGSTPAAAELRYDPADPYAVSVTFFSGSHDVTWVFARDLLIGGVHEPAGDGDVGLFPSLGPDGHAVVVLELRAPGGQALVEVPAREVLTFLARSTRAVWPGTEADHLRLDDAIAEILVDAG